MTPVRPLLSALLSACLAVQPLFAAGSPRPQASRFPSEHEAALEKAAESFVAAGQLDADALVNPLVPLATDPEDKSDLARFRALLKEAAALREPVAAKPGAPADGPVPEILDAKYKSRVLALALKLKADGAKAAETRRELLRKHPPVGPDGKPAAAVPGADQPPLTDQDRAAIARMEARGPIDDGRAMSSAKGVAAALDKFKQDTGLPPGVSPEAAADAREAEVLGAAAAAFKGGPTTLTTASTPAPTKGRLERFRDATTLDGLQGRFQDFSKRKMAEAGALEDRAAADFANGKTLSGVFNAAEAWRKRLLAADPATVKQVAVGVGVLATAAFAIAAAPVVLPALAVIGSGAAIGPTAAAVGVVALKGVIIGLGGYSAYGSVKGAGEFAHKPDLVNGALLAANVGGLGLLAKGVSAGVVGTKTLVGAGTSTGGRAAAGAGGIAAAAPRAALAAGENASGAAVGGAVEAAAGQTATQVAVRPVASKALQKSTEEAVNQSAEALLEVPSRRSSAK